MMPCSWLFMLVMMSLLFFLMKSIWSAFFLFEGSLKMEVATKKEKFLMFK